MTDLIDTTEMYLRTIYELIEDGVVPMRARIAEQLEHSGPTVSQTVARMERDGLVVVAPGDHHLEFTPEGAARATRVMRKHRLAERLLADVIGLNIAHVHEEACRWEHVMSDLVEERLLELVGDPTVSPYGNPIPGLRELGVRGADAPAPPGVSADSVASGAPVAGRLVRLGEPAQVVAGLLDEAAAARLAPGAEVVIERHGADVRIHAPGGAIDVDATVARHIFVSVAGSDATPG